MKPNGFIIYEGTKNGSRYAVIATLKTSNRKTGNMIQLWILLADHSPVEGVKRKEQSNKPHLINN